MIKIRSVLFALLVIAVSIAAFGSVGQAAVNCPQVPTVKWWGKTTHQKITNYVAVKHDGDWIPYIDKWNRQLAKMQEIFDRGGAAIFKKQGVTIEDTELAQYIKAIKLRLMVTRCLALNEFERAAAEMDSMETASGEDEPAPKKQ